MPFVTQGFLLLDLNLTFLSGKQELCISVNSLIKLSQYMLGSSLFLLLFQLVKSNLFLNSSIEFVSYLLINFAFLFLFQLFIIHFMDMKDRNMIRNVSTKYSINGGSLIIKNIGENIIN